MKRRFDQLAPDQFETAALLRAVDAVDELRDGLKDGEDGRPPQLRSDLLRLHQLATAVFNQGARAKAGELFDLAVDLQDEVFDLLNALEQIQATLSQLTALQPEGPAEQDAND